MVERRGKGKEQGDVQGPFLCVSGVLSSNHGTQLLDLGRFPYPWHQATDCPNQGTLSILPSIASSSSARSCARPTLAPLHIVLLLR